MNLRIMFACCIAFGFSSLGAASEPFADVQMHKSGSMYTAEGDDDGYLTGDESGVFPMSSHEPVARANHFACHQRAPGHVALDIDRVAGVGESVRDNSEAIEHQREQMLRSAATSVEPTVASMKSFAQVNPHSIFDRDEYLRAHVNRLIEDEKRYKTASRVCRWCNVSWLGVGGTSTAASLIISAIGATAYIDPRLANVLCLVFGVVSGGCLWGATQSKKASHAYYQEMTTIQKALGVPERLVEPEVDLRLDAFKGDPADRPAGASATVH